MQPGAASSIVGSSGLPEPATKLTKKLLLCGVVAGPLYVVLGWGQAFTREGFDPARHPLSLLSNGPLGWIQIANFVVTGLMVIACATAMRNVKIYGAWGPLLLGVYGLGLIAAGIFVADPAMGFPPGTPMGPPRTISTHGMLHFMSGGVGFLGLIASCFAFARRFATQKQSGWAAYSVATGVIFFAAFFGIASGSGKVWIIIAFSLAVVLAWAWITAMAARTLRAIKD